MEKFIEIQNEVIKKYRVKLCYGELCENDWSRTHAHVKRRTICKWKQKNSVQSTFDLLHEIGHIMTTKGYHRRCESEYYATEWALKIAREDYGLVIPESTIQAYNDYIAMEHDRGIRRGGSLPALETLILK
jgi:hypothetical protein